MQYFKSNTSNNLRRIMLCCCLVIVPIISRADNHSTIFGGLKLGAHISRLEAASWDQDYRVNMHGGIFLGVRTSRLGIQAEGNFNQNTYRTGSSFKDFYQGYYQDLKDSVRKGSFQVRTVTVPLLLQLRLLGNVWVQAGPEYSMLLSVEDKDDLLKDAEEMFREGAINGVVGLWIQSGRHLNFGGRYIFSITDRNAQALRESWQLRTIQIHIGYTL